jgi:asparagine synthase (glutamine-hydrolysing)
LAADGPSDPWSLDALQREVLPPDTVSALIGRAAAEPIRPPSDGSASPFEQLVEAEVELYLQSTLLPDADTFSMCSSVELRVPFVDPCVFAAAAAAVRATGTSGKRLAARAIGDSFLDDLAGRAKRGFSLPMHAWMKSGPLTPACEALASTDAPLWSVVDREAASPLLLAGSPRWSELWSLVALNAWMTSVRDQIRLTPATPPRSSAG